MPSIPAPNAEIHVLIIGAGITGLLLAHGLEQVGVS
jgi:2-polyprenyl-6-methoxyphenol hydroxylase-like FAD-dependent oxidoreductase